MILLITTLFTALISGFFYAYSCSVNPRLGRLANGEYLRAMQYIKQAVLNPVFFLSFFGTLIMIPVSTWGWYSTEGGGPKFYFLLAATLIYAVGVFGVTGLGNVPLNETLDQFNIQNASATEVTGKRKNFETTWNRYHTIRTWANLVFLVLVLWVLAKQ